MMKFFKIVIASFILVIGINFLLKFAMTIKTSKVAEEDVAKDPQLGWDFANYKKKTFNDLGFRTPLSSDEIIKTNKDIIVFLGNSVVAGDALKYNEVFAYMINDFLPKEKYLVLNAGSEGYEIYREYLKYVRDYSKVAPKFVVWFPSSNDYQNKEEIFRNFVETAEAQGTTEGDKVKEKFYKKFISGFNLLAARIQANKEAITEKFLWSAKHKFYTEPLLSSLPKTNLGGLKAELKSFHEYLNKHDTKLITVFLPPQYFCKFHQWKDAKSFLELEEILKDLNIKSITMFDSLPCRDKKIFHDYVHFNEEGHKEIAKILAKELTPHLN